MTASAVIKILKKSGFEFDRQAKGSHEIWYNGSHEIWYNAITSNRVTIPNHPGADIPKGTLKAIIKQTGLSTEEFLSLRN
jgi:predicted RNA binding protein YcfA (HicA-like mRNA interferase family)